MKSFLDPVRKTTGMSLVMALALGLTACGGGGAASRDDESNAADLRFSWWGSDPRHQANLEIIDLYEADNPDVSIEGEYGDWSGYWDKLATGTAGGDAPDIITMDEKYLLEYADRGALADLTTLENLDLSKFSDEVLDLGRSGDGVYGLSTGQNTPVLMANVDLFEEAGVELPDDTTWTWQDYYRLSAEINEKLDGVHGATYGADDTSLKMWLRQNDEELYTDDGDAAGYSTENLVSWFEHLIEVRENGGISPEQFMEEQSAGFEARAFSTNKSAMDWFWSNQMGALQAATGTENLRFLRVPSQTGKAADNGMYYKSSMYWSVSSQSKNPDVAADFVNFLANEERAAKIMLVDRGVPANPDMAAAVEPELGEADRSVLAFLKEIEPDMAPAPRAAPIGSGGVPEVIGRYVSEVLFDKLTPEKAAEQMTQEINNMLAAA